MSFIIIILVLLLIIFTFRKIPVIPKSRWSHHFDEFKFSAQDFYAQIEAGITKRQLPKITFSRTTSPETNIFSTRREYLTVKRGEYVFDICAAPFGTGFFISWWLGEHEEGVLSKIPVLNRLPGNRRNKTYYQIDTETMFKSAVHNVILSVIDDITNNKGVRPLSDIERQPKDK